MHDLATEYDERVEYRFVDCRPREAYLTGHVPGPRTPTRRAISRAPTAAAGIRSRPPTRSPHGPLRPASAHETLVVAYDEGTGWAARLWWLLRHFGHDEAAVIDVDDWHGTLRPDREQIERAEFVTRPRTDDIALSPELLERLDDPGADDRRRPGPRAVARRGRADRSGRGADPRLQQPFFRGRDAAAAGAARRRRARRLLRLGRHGLPGTARAPPRGTHRRAPLSRLVERVVRDRAGGTRVGRTVAASWCARCGEIPYRCARTSSCSPSSSSTTGSSCTSRSRIRTGRPS